LHRAVAKAIVGRMTEIRIDKSRAAGRQIDAAIRMTLSGEDSVVFHSVIAAAHHSDE
jgi:hypothetical protein